MTNMCGTHHLRKRTPTSVFSPGKHRQSRTNIDEDTKYLFMSETTGPKTRMLGGIVSRVASPTQDGMKRPEMHKKVKVRTNSFGVKKKLGEKKIPGMKVAGVLDHGQLDGQTNDIAE